MLRLLETLNSQQLQLQVNSHLCSQQQHHLLSDISLAVLSSNQSQLLEPACRIVAGHAPMTSRTSDLAGTRDLSAAGEAVQDQVTHLDTAGKHTHNQWIVRTIVDTGADKLSSDSEQVNHGKACCSKIRVVSPYLTYHDTFGPAGGSS